MRMMSKEKRQTMSACAALVVIFSIACFCLFWNLDAPKVVDYDEARHGINAYEMIQNNDYLVHTYEGEPDLWNLKPPFSYWTVALGYRLFGYNRLGLRFFSALCGVLTLLALTGFCWKRLGKAPAVMAAALFALNQGLYRTHSYRLGEADGLYQLFFALAMLCMLLSRRDIRWYYGGCLSFALAFLSKATHAAMIPIVYLCFFLATKQWKQLSWKRALSMVACALGPVLVWAAARYSRDGLTFFEAMLKTDVVGRIGSDAGESDAQSIFAYYLPVLTQCPAMLAGLAVSLLGGGYCLAARIRPSREKREILLGTALWALVPVVVYFLFNVRYHWYLYTLYTAIPVMAATVLSVIREGTAKRAFLRLLAAAAGAAMVFCAWQSVTLVANARMQSRYQAMMDTYLSREEYSGCVMYIQYYDDEVGTVKDWMPGDKLCAMLDGDVVCRNGGIEGFLQEEDWALILFWRDSATEEEMGELTSFYLPVCDEGYLYLFEN